jgi:hypothetical protein
MASLVGEGESMKRRVPKLEISLRTLDMTNDLKPVAASERVTEKSALLIKAQSPKVAIGSKVLADIFSGLSKRPNLRVPF